MSTLTKIFDWIIISSVAATFLTVIILFIKGITRTKQSAKWHYYIWFILVIRLLLPYAPNSSISIFNTITPVVEKISAHESNLKIETPINTESLNRISVQSNSTEVKTNNQAIDIKDNKIADWFNLKSSLMLIWLLGVCVFAVYTFFINLRILLKTRSESNLQFSAINKTIKECKKILNINRDIPIVITKDISSPSLLGFINPILLLPKGILGKINNDELKHIILHELSHYKRKDNIVNWLIVFLKILHWFNPILWYGFYKMREDCEIACDSMAMTYMNQKEQELYGYTIVHLLKITSRERYIAGTMGILSSKSGMKRRINMISLFNKKKSKFSITGLVILVALGLILLTNAKNDNKFTNKIVGANSKASVSSANNKSEQVADFSSKESISIFDIKGRNFDGKLMIIPNSKKIVIGYSMENSKINKTTSQIAKAENAIAAINAGGFTDKSFLPRGIIMSKGKIVYNDYMSDDVKDDVVAITKDNILLVGKHTVAELKESGVTDAVSFGPALIVNGQKTITSGDGGWGKAPRTAIGQKKDGSFIFLVLDGVKGKRLAASLKEVQDVLYEYGAYTASNLDGGSSSTMYYKGDIINKPFDPAGERVIPSTFLVN